MFWLTLNIENQKWNIEIFVKGSLWKYCVAYILNKQMLGICPLVRTARFDVSQLDREEGAVQILYLSKN